MKKNAVAKSTPVETFHSNTSEDEFTINTYQDARPIVDENTRVRNDYGDLLSKGKSGEGVRVASIPFNVWTKWKEETKVPDGKGGWIYMVQQDPKVLAKYLNDPDNKYLRTTPTRV